MFKVTKLFLKTELRDPNKTYDNTDEFPIMPLTENYFSW